MSRRIEDALAALYNKNAASIAICLYVRAVGGNQHVVSRFDNELPATAIANFVSPDEGSIVICISSGGQLALIGSLT